MTDRRPKNEISFIKQGFLCPECKTEYENVTELETHFNTMHLNNERSTNENYNQNNLGNHLNKFLGKAKKILKTDSRNQEYPVSGEDRVANEDVAASSSSPSNPSTNFRPKYSESECYFSLRKDQTIGYSKDHFDERFRKMRNSKIERDVQETNKLLIRIDQLLHDLPIGDPEKLRAHEMSVVIWANDEDVRLCPTCAKSFNISRRRHHCRLCGAIMCTDCSFFLDLNYARQLIYPVDLEASSSNNVLTVKDTSSQPPTTNLITSNKSNVKRAGTPSLLQMGMNLANNITNKDAGEYKIKTCEECKVLLDRRMQQITNQHTRPLLKSYYEKLKNLQLESDKLVPLYIQMCRSLRTGESIYQLEDAQMLRIKLMKLGDAMDGLSKQILQLNFEGEANDYQSLRNKLRLFVAQYLQRNLLGLPSLPYEFELKELQERRHEEIKKALETGEDTQAVVESKNNSKSNTSPTRRRNNEIVSTDNGWNIDKIQLNDGEDDDPILLQINIIKQYIEQARTDHRYEELNLLESNLKQLEIEYFLQENEKQQVDYLGSETTASNDE